MQLFTAQRFKAVGESVRKALEYYQNNITGTLTLMKVMREVGGRILHLVLLATVYGNPRQCRLQRTARKRQCTNPYG